MKLLLIGHFSYDVFHEPDGTQREQPGGLQRAILCLSGLCTRQDRIIPVLGIGSDAYAKVIDEMRELPNVDSGAIFPIDGPTHRVHYYPGKNRSRVACVTEMAPSISFDRIRKFLDADGVWVNMMSGRDIRLETLDEIRMAIRGSGTRVHFDFHNLTLGIGSNAERVRQPVPDWRRWGFMMNTVQLNEEEIAGLSADHLTEQQTAGHLLTLSVTGVLVTRGAAGASVYFNEHKKIVRKDFPVSQRSPGMAVGSGDLFGAAFLWHYCRTNDLFAAAEGAVSVAAESIPA
jgi:sugar/nucleoside kinase (ribokinase family)